MPVDAYCKGCAYLGTNSMGKCCDYNYITGMVRGCPAGNGCTQRLIGAKRKYAPLAYTSPKHVDSAKKAAIASKTIGRPKGYGLEPRIRRQKITENLRAEMQGRQREAILAYKMEHNASSQDIAELIGVHPSTVQKWCNEVRPARWDLLAKLGIQKPKGA